MSASYLKITARRLFRQKTFSAINILGLSIGLAACLLLFLYVYSEMTYDAYNGNTSRIALQSGGSCGYYPRVSFG